MARPREFDIETALRAMMNLFWEFGYEGTSMQMIERATGLRKQSLYRAFGDKRAMYLAALAAYEREEISKSADILTQPGDAATRFGRLFRHLVDQAVDGGDRRGCFLCNAGTDQAPLDAASGRAVSDMVSRVEQVFEKTLRDAGESKQHSLFGQTARALMTGYFGLRVLVKTGADRETLEDAAHGVLAILDASP